MEFKQPTRPRPSQPQPRASEPAPTPEALRPFFTKKNWLIIGIVTLGVIILGFASWFFVSLYDSHQSSGERPAFDTVLPSNKSIDELGGWTRISPPNNEPVFAYTDQINNVPITVSQQRLPENLLNIGTSELAKQFNATNRLGGLNTEVYYGTSAKGPQSVIFAMDELLVLIKSQAKIEDKAWVTYINSLN